MRRFMAGMAAALLAACAARAQEDEALLKEMEELRRRVAGLEAEREEARQRLDALRRRMEGGRGEAEAERERALEGYRRAREAYEVHYAKADLKALADRYRRLAEVRLRRGLERLRLEGRRLEEVKEHAGKYLDGITRHWVESRRLAGELKRALQEEAGEDHLREILDMLYGVEKERAALEGRFRGELRRLLDPHEEARYVLEVLDFDLELRRGLEALRPGGVLDRSRDLMEALRGLSRKVREEAPGDEMLQRLEELREAAKAGLGQLERLREEEMVRLRAALEELERQKRPALEELDRVKGELKGMMEELRERLEEAARAIEEARERRRKPEEKPRQDTARAPL